jgi:hypothetical protein
MVGHHVCVTCRVHRLIVAIAVWGALGSGCSSGHGSGVKLPPAGNSIASLKATARSYAHAFLVGSLDDMQALQGPECAVHSGTTIPIRTRSQYLRAERAVMRKYLGRPPDKIKISRVAVRNVTSTSGEALVNYDLPAAVVGNYNWVTYTVHNGRWKVSDCHGPIGGRRTVSTPAP